MFKLKISDSAEFDWPYERVKRYYVKMGIVPEKSRGYLSYNIYFSSKRRAYDFLVSLSSLFKEVIFTLDLIHGRLSLLDLQDSSNTSYGHGTLLILSKVKASLSALRFKEYHPYVVIDHIKAYISSLINHCFSVSNVYKTYASDVYHYLDSLNDWFSNLIDNAYELYCRGILQMYAVI